MLPWHGAVLRNAALLQLRGMLLHCRTRDGFGGPKEHLEQRAQAAQPRGVCCVTFPEASCVYSGFMESISSSSSLALTSSQHCSKSVPGVLVSTSHPFRDVGHFSTVALHLFLWVA